MPLMHQLLMAQTCCLLVVIELQVDSDNLILPEKTKKNQNYTYLLSKTGNYFHGLVSLQTYSPRHPVTSFFSTCHTEFQNIFHIMSSDGNLLKFAWLTDRPFF